MFITMCVFVHSLVVILRRLEVKNLNIQEWWKYQQYSKTYHQNFTSPKKYKIVCWYLLLFWTKVFFFKLYPFYENHLVTVIRRLTKIPFLLPIFHYLTPWEFVAGLHWRFSIDLASARPRDLPKDNLLFGI